MRNRVLVVAFLGMCVAATPGFSQTIERITQRPESGSWTDPPPDSDPLRAFA